MGQRNNGRNGGTDVQIRTVTQIHFKFPVSISNKSPSRQLDGDLFYCMWKSESPKLRNSTKLPVGAKFDAGDNATQLKKSVCVFRLPPHVRNTLIRRHYCLTPDNAAVVLLSQSLSVITVAFSSLILYTTEY